MGKGDKKTAKGKRTMGSYGNTRKKKVTSTSKPSNEGKVVTPKEDKPKKVVAKKEVVAKETTKKAPAKKTAKKED